MMINQGFDFPTGEEFRCFGRPLHARETGVCESEDACRLPGKAKAPSHQTSEHHGYSPNLGAHAPGRVWGKEGGKGPLCRLCAVRFARFGKRKSLTFRIRPDKAGCLATKRDGSQLQERGVGWGRSFVCVRTWEPSAEAGCGSHERSTLLLYRSKVCILTADYQLHVLVAVIWRDQDGDQYCVLVGGEQTSGPSHCC